MDKAFLPEAPKAKLKPSRGGLLHLERFLGLRKVAPDLAQDPSFSDVVLVSLDLEVSSSRDHVTSVTSPGEQPAITQIGFAVLDTRELGSYPLDLQTAISVQFFTVSDISLQSKTAKNKGKRRCVFTKPKKIKQSQTLTTILQNLQIRDKYNNGALRNIALIGHSIKEDLKMIRFLGMDVFDIAPISIVIDTYLMARYVLPPYSPVLPLGPDQRFSLAAVLHQLGCPPGPLELHNAGNDAVYTAYAMLPVLLAIKNSTNRMPQLTAAEQKKLDTLRLIVSEALEADLGRLV